jgi:hypothetical protein
MKPSFQKDRIKTISDLVIGLFIQRGHLRDAVADLAQAGFHKSEILVAFPIEGQPYLTRHSAVKHIFQPGLGGKHSLIWKLKQSFEHDLHRRGQDQLSGRHEDSSLSEAELYSEVPLRDALQEIGVALDRIILLNNEMGPDGALLLVQAGGRWRKVESILQRNSGMIRTDTATERSHSAA